MINSIKIVNNKEEITQKKLYEFLRTNSIEVIKKENPPVSFNYNNEPVSYWNDLIWDFSQEKVKKAGYSSMLYREEYSHLKDSLYEELKYMSILTYLHSYKNYKYSNELQRKSADFATFINAIHKLGLNSICEISDELRFISVLEHIKGEYTSGTLKDKLNDFRRFCEIEKPCFPLYINFGVKQARKILKGFSIKELSIKYSKNQTDSVNQTLYIPTNIHSKLISTCIEMIYEKSKKIDNIMSFLEDDYLLYEQIKKDLNLSEVSSGNSKKKIRRKKLEQTKLLLEKYNLSKFNSLVEIQKEVRLLATSCLILMLNFSGMRANELCNIKIDGFKVVNSEPTLYILRSYETKISGGQVVDYVTSPVVQDAFNIIKKIHVLARKYDKSINQEDLIISSKHQKLLSYGGIYNIGVHIGNFAKEISLTINSADIKESELLNGPREDIKIGNIWPLASHQFRRTLIVNFVSHRIGSINAVKQQVKHMYATMTEYYAKNSKLAETFNLNVVKDIADDIQEELLDEGVRQYKEFYYSDEVLAGNKGSEIMEERKITKILSDKEIKQLFKTGLYKISKSMYGYCTKGNLCDKKDAIDPTFCGASCNTMIITKENALNWQKLFFRNKKLLNLEDNFMISGIPLSASKTTMQSQNEVAKGIMNKFNIKYED